MSEAATRIGIGLTVFLLRRLLKRKKKEERKEEKKEEEKRRERPPTTYDAKTEYIIRSVMGEDAPLPMSASGLHNNGWGWIYDSHPDLGDAEKWKRLVPKHPWIHGGKYIGNLMGIPLTAGVTAITLTPDGRFFTFPQAKDPVELAYTLWEPFFAYIEQKAKEIQHKKGITFQKALREAIYSLGIHSGLEPGHPPQWQIESVYVLADEPEERKLALLRALKKIYLDELKLGWMPLPLNNKDHFDKEGDMEKSNKIYLKHIPTILKEIGIDPEDPLIKLRLKALETLLYKTGWPEYYDIREALALLEQLHIENKITDQEYQQALQQFTQDPKTILKKIEQLAKQHAGEEAEEREEAIAPKLMATVYEERLPGAAARIATILHAMEQGAPITPETLEKIIEETTAPHSPQGTQLYTLLYRILDRAEQHLTHGQKPPQPSKLIEETLREALALRPHHDIEKELQKSANGESKRIILAKTALAAPTRPPHHEENKRLARVLLNLLHKTREMEQGRADPALEDVRTEMALLARNLPTKPREPTEEYLQRINPQTLEAIYNDIHREYTEKAIQIGKETALQTLQRALEIAKQEMEKHRDKPYPEMVAATTEAVRKQLLKELGSSPEQAQEARWASLTVQHILQALPLAVAETPEELGMAKHLLTQGYNPEEYDLPLYMDVVGELSKASETEIEDAKQRLLRIREGSQAAEAVKNTLWKTLEAYRQHREELGHEHLMKSLAENVKTVSRVRPRPEK